MNLDFPAILVLLCFISGGIWLADALLFAPRRCERARAAAAAKTPGAEPSSAAVQAEYREPTLVEYARSFFPVILIVLLLRSFLFEPFRIPSNSMMPTLLTGDFILVNKYAYGLRLPVLNTKIVPIGEPQRGDVVVFRFPLAPQTDYIKRVVGLPGDEIAYRGKTIYINGAEMGQLPIGSYTGVGSGAVMTGARQALESLDGVEHRILTRPDSPNLPPGCQALSDRVIQVPEGAYFVMGDNRDNSNDSRCWGFVPERNLVGRAFAIWMHWDGAREGLPIAWSRLGDKID